ncbi:hypothetical protein AAFC00_005610 [Neodothiora populina]|uniref:Fatty acid hydroxylase domain-containing protein n=1 Tax=Neodothiora populina TaxID=2781224 RepID=A0ABR3PLH0_9PEZI
MALQTIRDSIVYNHGYFEGRTSSVTDFLWSLYGTAMSKATSVASIPLPMLSFLALPFFGSTSTTINLAFFWLVWTTFVWKYDPLEVEIYGTLAIRCLFFLLPSYLFLGIDALLPSLATSIKANGSKSLPLQNMTRSSLAKITAVATANTLMAVALQGAFEYILTEYLHFRSGLRVSTFVPPPWSIAKDVLRALAMRGLTHYAIHRYVLHASPSKSPIAKWHQGWAHAIQRPFSIVAAYDHPICYLLAQWIPLYLPAFLFRYHVLTWHILVALTSLEELFIYSGYAVLPSSILLSGMARRTDAHYETNGKGNFGHWGVLDWVFGTTCPGGADVVDDLKDEAEERNVRERLGDAKDNAEGLVGDAKERFGGESDQAGGKDAARNEDAAGGEAGGEADGEAAEAEPESPSQGGKRRSKRRAREASAAS